MLNKRKVIFIGQWKRGKVLSPSSGCRALPARFLCGWVNVLGAKWPAFGVSAVVTGSLRLPVGDQLMFAVADQVGPSHFL